LILGTLAVVVNDNEESLHLRVNNHRHTRGPTMPNGIADPFTHDLRNAFLTRHARRNELIGKGGHTPSNIARAAPLIRHLIEPVA
jgi:hypothetical protein